MSTTTLKTPAATLPITLPDENKSTIYFWKQLPVKTSTASKKLSENSTSALKGDLISPSSQIFAANPIDQTSDTPLAPKADLVTYISDDSINLEVTVYIDSNYSPKNLNLYLSSIDNINITTLDVYICYDGLEEVPDGLYPYTFNLSIDKITQTINGTEVSLESKKLKSITTYLHNSDPVTSRGTTTTVKKEMM
ncbi:hypothetical protein [uncultured Kordia sp.]|uniref:hypothetical protein n=1 Tax=uncultured Kordia sp. TaxID=507699 RepID=UPI002636F669|nr:hypothetical protein [uncultured Kordia sp.]